MMQVKQISDNEIYLFIKYTKSFLWKVAKRLSYTKDARCLKVNYVFTTSDRISNSETSCTHEAGDDQFN